MWGPNTCECILSYTWDTESSENHVSFCLIFDAIVLINIQSMQVSSYIIHRSNVTIDRIYNSLLIDFFSEANDAIGLVNRL